ncbi:hypothetical protein QQF54_12945 [Lelliottia sp. V106_10]|uniref:hypothetical protein n=1 Tax=Lelliottia wanjuensis TaxID=3050585 RepID=UPI00254B387B|nr:MULTISPECIES: hypothetical protein [unclassified Lelliottia]MDK9356365.1 hypothetical protein [Lelliottia sp. V106_16]MDK9374248.1 hypothetical protein [Lelliottia sp. V106_10]MDK9601518.1 hypothetical protein [Lelliottia sp. V106_5]
MPEEKSTNNPGFANDGWQPVDKGYQPPNKPTQKNGYQPPSQNQQPQQVSPPPKKR